MRKESTITHAGVTPSRRTSSITPTITAFERSPDGGKGLARDTRVRWALEEVGQPYEVRPVSFRAMKQAAHLAIHPFGQIPTYEEGDLALFETGAIVLHIAERHETGDAFLDAVSLKRHRGYSAKSYSARRERQRYWLPRPAQPNSLEDGQRVKTQRFGRCRNGDGSEE